MENKSDESIAKEKAKELIVENTPPSAHVIWETKQSPVALPLHNPEIISLSGTIEAPYEFISKRKSEHEPLAVHVMYNLENGVILLKADERNHFKTTIKGELKMNPKMVEFGINADKKYNLTELKKKIRFSKTIFKNEAEHAELIKGLNEFTSKVSQELKKEDDGKGNVDERFLQTVTTNLKTSFVAKMQIYKGAGEREFKVELILECRSKVIEFWFESPEAIDVIETEREGLVMTQINKLNQDYVCIQE
jgi:hypothetical protein